MNQILVTETIYVTPELKRKKKTYKLLFILSVFSIISLFTIYAYAEYDRNKEEDISTDILASIYEKDNIKKEDETTIDTIENALVVKITQDTMQNFPEEEIEKAPEIKPSAATAIYTAPNGRQYENIGIVRIPKINITYPILSKTTDELLKVSACKFHGANPNEVGNLCVIAHNYRRKGVFFSDIPKLEIGDVVEIEDLSHRVVQYEIYDIHTVIPDNVDDTTQKTNGRREVTLITCTNNSKQRIIVKCKEKI